MENDIPQRKELECPFEKLYPSQLNIDDEFYMKYAYNQAIEAWKHDEVPVGAVIVYQDTIVAAAHNQVDSMKDPTAHAEILAITQAARAIEDWRLNEATLYVTKEPCPMCSGACIMSRIGRIVYAAGDPKMGCLGGASSLHELPQSNHKPEVSSGVLEEDCRTLLKAYFALKRDPESPGEN